MEAQEIEPIILEVEDLARGGAGVARAANGQIVFVPFSAPGDRVKVILKDVKKRYAQAEIIEILDPSPLRETPRCPIFGKCGGCQWQHIPYPLQWKTKVRGVQHALTRVRCPQKTVTEFPAEKIWEYRNRIQLRGEGQAIGFYRSGSHDLVAADRCDIARPEINESWNEVRQEAQTLKSPFKVEVEVLPGGRVRKTWNARHAAAGFRQVHDEQNEKMLQWVANKLTPGRILLDLFGGSGNFSRALAKKMFEVHCVDVSAPRERPEGVPENVFFYRSSVLKWLLKKSQIAAAAQKNNGQGRDTSSLPRSVILDPPRQGLGTEFSEIASALDFLRASEIILVGCDPDAWARDLSRWARRGWSIQDVMVIDLFPHTVHVESIAMLKSSQFS